MNDYNKNFIKEFRDRTSNYKEFNIQIRKIYTTKREIELLTTKIIKFLNENVMSTATSSLVQTGIILPIANTSSYYSNDIDEYITFNHKGIGTIRVPKNKDEKKYIYGTTRSEQLSTKEFLNMISDETIYNSIIEWLDNNDKKKLLKHFSDIIQLKEEILKMSKISYKYIDACEGLSEKLDEPQEIFYIQHKENNDIDSAFETILTKFTITKIHIDDQRKIRLETKEIIDEAPNYENEYGKKTGIPLYINNIETSMIFMQFPNELKNVLNKIEEDVMKDYNNIIELNNIIEGKLAIYSVLKSLT